MRRLLGIVTSVAVVLTVDASSAVAGTGARLTRGRDGRSGVVAEARSFTPPSTPSRTAGPSSAQAVAAPTASTANTVAQPASPARPAPVSSAALPLVIDAGAACPALYGTGSAEPFTSVPETRAAHCVYALPRTEDGDEDAAPPPDPLALARVATDRALALAPRPQLEVAPERKGLVGLQTFVWLRDEPVAISASASVPGMVVTAEARPVEFVWTFGDGDERITDHSGKPWRRRHPGDIAHVYESRGRFDLEVEVVWEARWRIDEGSWNHLGYFSDSDARPYAVREVVGMLVRPS